jgi:hypothetical protein
VQTQISLANNATTSVQDMSAYDAQEVMGFVYVDATADLRAYFTVTVVKNGAGTYEIAGADVAGDQSGTGASAIAPVSFSMSGSTLQATLPNITGFASAFLRYQLSAPYLGGNYPLSVDASQLVSGTVAVARLPLATQTVSGLVNNQVPPTNLAASDLTSQTNCVIESGDIIAGQCQWSMVNNVVSLFMHINLFTITSNASSFSFTLPSSVPAPTFTITLPFMVYDNNGSVVTSSLATLTTGRVLNFQRFATGNWTGGTNSNYLRGQVMWTTI